MPTSSYTFQILLEGKDAIAAAKRIRAELQRELSQGFDLRKEMANIGTEARTTAGRMAQMERELQGATRESGRLEVDLRDADDATRRLVNDFFQGKINADQLEQSLRGSSQAVEATRQEVKWLGRDLQEVAQMGRMERLGAAMTAAAQQTYGLRTLAGGLGRVGTGMMTTGAAIVAPLTLAGQSYLEFSANAGQAARQLKLNAELTDELKSKTLDLSASLGLFTPEEISQGLYTWASAIGAVAESEEDLDRLLKDSTEIQKLASMNQEELGTTTAFVAAILGEFNLETSQTKRVVALLNYTADRTQATVSDLGESLKFVGPIAATLGEDVEDVAAALGVAADAGIKASMSGRAMRQMYISLADPTAEMTKAFNEALGLSGELGQSWQDIVFQGGKFIGTAATIDLLAAATENMTDQQRMALLAHLATANELPVLTALVVDQIEARKEGINSMRAWKKQAEGTIDAEVQAYARWREATKGIQVSQEDMFESWEREWQTYEEEDHARADRVTARWNAAWKRIGKAATESALPALEELAALMDKIGRYAEEHPATVKAILESGALLVGVGALVKAASSGIRLYADWQMIGAAATMLTASENMLTAAGVQQTATGGKLLGGLGGGLGVLGKLGLTVLSVYGGLEVGSRVVGQVRGETVTIRDALEEIWEYTRKSAALTAGTGGALTALLLGEDPSEAFDIAAYEAGKLFGLIEEEGQPAAKTTGDELRDWNVELERARRKVQGVGADLMQIPSTMETGLAKFSESELQAFDLLDQYLRDRKALIERQNEALYEMQQDFLEREEELHQSYLQKRADLEKELRQVVEDPLWRTTKEVIESQKRQADAYEEYQKRIAQTEAEYQKRLRELRENHEDVMEDLEASRDARGILAERRRYRRAVRDAEERKDAEVEAAEERWQEIVKTEREKLAEMREERKRDLEERLRELDENYQEETQKRRLEFEKRYQEKQAQNQKELQQFDRAQSERLAKIMGWEERVRDALRRSYIDREGDLRDHLAQMERMYLEAYDMISQMSSEAMTPEEYRRWHEEIRGHQAGGYAPRGVYRLGEAGREFVLSTSTTRALERAAGHLTQAKVVGMATGVVGRLELVADINVRADPVFGPEFAAQIKSDIRGEIVGLFKQVVATSHPGAHRLH
jgi:TP901 family phage tail tape measure protein